MRTQIISFVAFCLCASLAAQTVKSEYQVSVCSPDGQLAVEVELRHGMALYSVKYDEQTVLHRSSLGFVSNVGDFSRGLTFESMEIDTVRDSYDMDRTKQSHSDYVATRLVCQLRNAGKMPVHLEMQLSNHNLAFRYVLPREGETGSVRVMNEATSFRFPEGTTTFLTPQSDPMIGWKRTKPSYEEDYVYDAPMNQMSGYGHGWTFPCLFKVPAAEGNLWALLSETGVDSRYCGSHLSDFCKGQYTIAFPMPEENNGNGTVEPAFSLPGATPWRTLTVGNTLAPIVETTITQDVVKPRYETRNVYEFGKGTWSWIVWQDESINERDLKHYIDLASAMGYPYALVDNWWDTNIGKSGMERLARYAQSKNVDLFVWYSSSGYWNDIEQGPINRMDNSIARKQEMRWLRSIGAKGIKVDFFGGDKQETMRLYEEILSDADDNGLMVIFHGCTIPRGWERMYPNYVGSEAVLASENIYFNQRNCDIAQMCAATHPFIRNAIGCMEFGGCFMNRRMSRDNAHRNYRRTTDVAELATCILFQNPIQNFALTPNNLEGVLNEPIGEPAPKVCMDFLKRVPTTWDETRLLEGYPGKYVALARRHGNQWYISAINAEEQPRKLTLDLSILPNIDLPTLVMISGGNEPFEVAPKLKKGKLSLSIENNDGVVIYNR